MVETGRPWRSPLWPALLLTHLLSLVAAQSTAPPVWRTLSGNTPVVVAKGGFSGLFPDSSEDAYQFALASTSSNTTLWCDVRLTKDRLGICLPDIKLDNATTIANVYQDGKNTYLVNGVTTSGWFSVDYNIKDLSQVTLTQALLNRSPRFDPKAYPILTVQDVASKFESPYLWLNVQNDIFYGQFNLSMKRYIFSLQKRVPIDYISSPEVGFLRDISGKVKSSTKLIFSFVSDVEIEPSTNQTYDSLQKNLTSIKSFASGILVPKAYIWPVTSDNYLQPSTALVNDAHKAGLEVFAAGFANDLPISYNYSYDPLAEYLAFVDNGVFSVDGVITDFPTTPSEAVGCFVNLNTSVVYHEKPIVISHNGASGDYPDCTNLAYEKAVTDGADVIDCSVQVTKDGILVCMSSIDLMNDTTVMHTQFSSLATAIPDIHSDLGVYTFDLTWDDITKSLKPQISTPMLEYELVRNPRYRNAGNFLKLSDFLTFAKDKDLYGVLINIEKAAFLAQKLQFDMVNAVINMLNTNGYSNQTSQRVMIQSSDSSVLSKFRQQLANYDLVYTITEQVSDVDPAALTDIKKFANAVAVSTLSIMPENHHFTTQQTNLVQRLHSANLSVYAYVLLNEAWSQPYDFFSDATAQLMAYVQGAGVDGVITDFPLTAKRYKVNSCLNMGNNTPMYMLPAYPGSLMQIIPKVALPPVASPLPSLPESDVVGSGNTALAEVPTAHRGGSVQVRVPVLGALAAMLCLWLFF